MHAVGGEQVEAAVAHCVALLRTVADRDWDGVTAGRLEWSCRHTAAHLPHAFLMYAGHLAGRVHDRRLPLRISVDEGADNAGVLRAVEAAGALLATAIRTAPREARGYHPYPFHSANREGFAAMGVAEALLHTHDIAEGLGVAYEPPADLCAFVLTRIFPHVRPGPGPWPTLLWATGRADLPGRAPVTEWHWYNNPVLPAGRLTLEGVTPAAAIDLSAGGDGGFPWLGGGPADGTREGAGMVVKQYEAGVHRPQWGMYVLVRRADGRAVGAMGFHGPPDEDGRVEVGYDLVGAARGHGYAAEALRALSAWALAREEVTSVFARVARDNLPSQGVVSRAGFTRVAEDGEQFAYALRK
ncbi:GNAT family N-acetyltransferase [Streptomyces sp. NPDC051041]|uniref:GNAT family N-acetyltransferase n=1 Tax=Streptomyces sp. NPDC051041 TaxID=3365640 RepID=UPI0037995D33